MISLRNIMEVKPLIKISLLCYAWNSLTQRMQLIQLPCQGQGNQSSQHIRIQNYELISYISIFTTLLIIVALAIYSHIFNRYFVFVSKHHEGYAEWPSTYSYGYNSMDVGPKRDVVGELSKAFRKNHPSIRFGLYYSLFEFYNPMYLSDKRRNFTRR